MKPFDLEKALAGEPVCTRDGKPVKIAGYNPNANYSQQIATWIDKECYSFDADGRMTQSESSSFDLFMAEKPKVKREGWVVVWRPLNYELDKRCLSEIFETADDAINSGYNNVKCILKIEWEEEAQ